MHSLFTILSVLVPMIAGFFFRLPPRWSGGIDRLLTVLIYLILIFIGIGLAQVQNLWQELGSIAFYTALLFALLAACNFAVLFWYDRRFVWTLRQQGDKRRRAGWTGGLVQLGVVAGGVVLGLILPEALLPHPDAGHYTLMAMVFLVGVQLRGNGIALRQVLINKRGLQISALFVLSCLLAGLLFSLLLPEVAPTQGIALSSGYGWYSLSGLMMTQAYGAAWGSVALLNDLLRELAALTLIPILMRRLPATAIASGGATSMDFMLPLIQNCGGSHAVPVAVSFGFITNLLAPVLMAVFSAW